jgi:hypothetical protein
MDQNLKREFVSVQHGANRVGIIETIKNISGCSVTEYNDTITIVCSTLRGIASLIDLSTEKGPEGPASNMFRMINEELIEFIG